MILCVAAGPLTANILIKRRIGYKIKPLGKTNRCAKVQQRIKEGWSFGDKPTDQEKAAARYTRAEWNNANHSYDGEIHNGKEHGQGIYKWKSGGRYEGKFVDGREVGGWYYFPDGGKAWCYRNEAGDQIAGRLVGEKGRWGTSMPKELERLAGQFDDRTMPVSAQNNLITLCHGLADEMSLSATRSVSEDQLNEMSSQIQDVRRRASQLQPSHDLAGCISRVVIMYRLFSGRETDPAFID